MIPDDVAAAWGWRPGALAPLAGGLINKTFVVRDDAAAPIAVLQQLHPIFSAEVNLDIEAVTSHLAARGLVTPRLLRTVDDRGWVIHEERVWRALSWVDGESVHAIPSAAWAEAGGRLVGRFHRAVVDLEHDYRFTRTGVHDTAAHLAKLTDRVARGGEPEAVELGRQILDVANAMPRLPDLPRRHVHGDLKISNLMFRRDPVEGICLVDLDTLARGTMAFELGDAMRSWCNPLGEDVTAAKFEAPIFVAAIRGFRSEADAFVTADERRSILSGLEIVAIELAARFAVDVFDDSYFGWDPTRFPSRRAHNLVRARGQLSLGRSVASSRDEVLDALLVRG